MFILLSVISLVLWIFLHIVGAAHDIAWYLFAFGVLFFVLAHWGSISMPAVFTRRQPPRE